MASNDAANSSSQQQNISGGGVQVRRENDPTLGFEFEKQMLLHAMLTMEDNQALARETKFVDKFDDIALIDTANNRLQLYQLKHKRNMEQVITWNDLFYNRSQRNVRKNQNHFYLKDYFESYKKRDKKSIGNLQIGELCFMTNAGFIRAQPQPMANQQPSCSKRTNLEPILTNWMAPQQQHLPQPQTLKGQKQAEIVWYITNEDLRYYFVEHHSKGIGTSLGKGKRYKFSSIGIRHVMTSYLRAASPSDSAEFEEFLKLVVYDVEQPHVEMLQKINQSILTLFFPIDWDTGRHHDQVKEKILDLFKPIPGTNNRAHWITLNERKQTFKDFTDGLKNDVPFGSIRGYEAGTLTNLFNQLNFDSIKHEYLNQLTPLTCPYVFNETLHKSENKQNNPSLFPLVNIFCNDSNPTVIALKLMRTFRDLSIQHDTLIVQVIKKEAIENITVHFEKLNREVATYHEKLDTISTRKRFYFVIEVSSYFTPVEETDKRIKEMVQSLAKFEYLRKRIQFVIITQQQHQIELENDVLFDFKSIEDIGLQWDHLTDSAKNYLYIKSLFVEGNYKKTPTKAAFQEDKGYTYGWETNLLEMLGLKVTDYRMDPISLAELIIHDKTRPLCLGLQKYDADLDDMYIHRKIELPLVETDEMSEDLKQRLVFKEEDFNRIITQKNDNDRLQIYHLLTPIDSTGSFYLWVKSNKTAEDYFELKDYVNKNSTGKSNYEIDESLLLLEDASFGTLSVNNKLAIVVDLSGKGKTFLLTSLTNQYLKDQSAKKKLSRLVLRFNLLEIKASSLRDITSMADETWAVDFLVNNLLFSENNKTSGIPLSRTIIKQMCLSDSTSAASIFVFLDGFDEISDEQRLGILKFVDQLVVSAKGIKRIILTSRPDNGLEEKLENHFKQFALHLKNFDERDQVEFLVKRWNLRLDQDDDERLDQNEANVRQYAEELVKFSKVTLKDENRSFLDVPLQCMIVSECFFNDLKVHLKKCQEDPTSPNLPKFHDQNFEIVRLYDHFYETKMDVLFKDKGKLAMKQNEMSSFVRNQSKKSFSESIQRLSVFHMMKTIDDAQVLCRLLSWKTYRNSEYRKDLERAMKLGLIRSVIDSGTTIESRSIEHLEAPEVKFIHRTFAEYFLATFLIDNFIQSESCLLDNAALPGDILKTTFEILIKKIFVDAEYAGTRRFFDRMLVNLIPPVGREKSPFAVNKRMDVIKKWPTISHMQFNTFVAQFLISICSPLFKQWKQMKEASDQFEINEIIRSNLTKFRELQKKPEGALLVLLQDDRYPSLSTLMIHCVKEYASRRDTSNDEREVLAYCVYYLLISPGEQYYDSSQHHGREKTVMLFMQWYDPAIDLSNEENRVFSIWLPKIVHKLTGLTDDLTKLTALGLACSRMKYHQQYLPDFENHVRKLVQSMFNESMRTIANKFFQIYATEGEMENDAVIAKKKSRHFVDVLSLSTLVSPDNSLLKLQVNWYRAQLVRYLNEAQPGDNDVRHSIYFTNPFTLVDTAEFLMNNLVEMNRSIATKAVGYIYDVLPLFLERILRENEDDREVKIKMKDGIVSITLWHLVLSDKIISCLPDDQSKLAAFFNLFSSAIGRCSLFAFANAACCKNANTKNADGLVIYFSSEMYGSEETIKRFENWFKHKLAIVWEGKTEREFIDFLFKDEMKLPLTNYLELNDHELPVPSCLLFSNLISEYIPSKLNTDGLQYLKETLQNVRLPRSGKSLWDVFSQDRRCPGRDQTLDNSEDTDDSRFDTYNSCDELNSDSPGYSSATSDE